MKKRQPFDGCFDKNLPGNRCRSNKPPVLQDLLPVEEAPSEVPPVCKIPFKNNQNIINLYKTNKQSTEKRSFYDLCQ